MNGKVSSFKVSTLYSNEEIFASLGVGNTGGVRVKRDGASGTVQRVVTFIFFPTFRYVFENPCYDRFEEGLLIYTGVGRGGEQAASGVNARFFEQRETGFPIYAFIQVTGCRDKSVGVKRWGFLGAGECLHGCQERETDVPNKARTVWACGFRGHTSSAVVTVARAKIYMNAHLGNRIWPLRHSRTQIQAKRWFHTVGRKEVAELRGSLQSHASDCLATSRRFSRVALAESAASEKVSVAVIDGYALARIVKSVGRD